MKHLSIIGACITTVLITFVPWHAQATLTLSDVPLFLTTAVEPNIMVTLDDSGSMQSEIMPEERVLQNVRYLFPRTAGVYGGGDYDNRVVDFDPNNPYAAALRSSQVNKIYYDPTVRYQPWSNADGSLMSNASPTCAPHNPMKANAGCRNLTASTTQTAFWLNSDGSLSNEESRTFYPAVYFNYNGGEILSANSYSRIEIKSTTLNSYQGGINRTDCAAAPICTYNEEIQNFANWYTYYRSRTLLSRAGVGKVLSAQGGGMRLGFGAIHKEETSIDNVSTGTIIRGVRQFTGTNRTAFFNNLYGYPLSTAEAPLRNATNRVGRYFMRTDDQGPWGETPGSNGGTQYVCRQNYHILVTDGYWDDSFSAVGNSDNTAGNTLTNHFPNATPATYTYTPTLPYSDSSSDTLADIAMHYWKNDLRPNLDNKVPTNVADPAFWQHLVHFTVGLGVQGALSSLPTGSETWPDPIASNAAKIDDLWHAAVNSRGGFFSAQDPAAFASNLSKALSNISSRVSSAAAVTTNTSRLNNGTHIYQAKFNSSDWSGQLFAYELGSNGSLGTILWEASSVLPAHASRTIFTHDGTRGLAFTSANFSSLSSSQQNALNTNISGAKDGLGMSRISWLRGDKTTEVAQGGSFRNRNNGLLGDIVNSDLLFVKVLNFGYDALPSGTAGQAAYAAYVQANASRMPVIYTGANDGMLHAFNAETGVELFSYIPSAVYPKLSWLTSPDYTHRYFVDGNTYTGDAYIGATPSWRTLLLGSLGTGGKSVFALDITDPVNFSASNVLWEFSDSDLGFTQGQAKIALLNNGVWAAIISNGYNSTNDRAYLYIIDLQTGALIKKIATNDSTSNGLSSPALVDTNSDRVIDIVYAGDLQGNVWKFDLSHTNSGIWDVAYKSGNTKLPLFTARNASNQVQPITSPLEIGLHPSGGHLVYFGTGQFIASGDNANADIQTLYGIWDNNESRISATDRSTLQQQTILTETVLPPFERTVSSNLVSWATKQGWYLDLLQPPGPGAQGERSVIMPQLNFGRIIFTTLIPSSDPCASGGHNWFMLLNAETGGMLAAPQFDTDDSGMLNNQDRLIAAMGSDGVRSESVAISAGNLIHLIAGSTTGLIETITVKGNPLNPRHSWKQIQ
ncbi:pilus assembly protein [Nitrosomonas sp. Nm58]|uniref:pilus assembly protein n=1 Tax=Nitrosomonas sp. Nm58 TaxID=200126 RepID=UPI00089D01FA|nr:PilC/PilY family type IV pilus protein [Nitrosomonas sp. Nm58]SDY52582.1 type IV pilus assembly protein PilY1 [Nitrosomonas sp. Nm58]